MLIDLYIYIYIYSIKTKPKRRNKQLNELARGRRAILISKLDIRRNLVFIREYEILYIVIEIAIKQNILFLIFLGMQK